MLSAVSSPSASTVATMQSLRSLNKQVSAVQTQIATGKRINSAKDDAAIWSLANDLQTDLAANKELAKGLSFASSAVKASLAGAESIVDLFQKMKSAVVQYQSTDSGTAKLADAQTAITNIQTQITELVSTSSFQGIKLLDNSADLTVVINNQTGGSITITKQNMTAVGTTLGTASAAATTYAGLLTAVDAAITSAKTIATNLGVSASRVETQNDFQKKLNDNLSTSISALVDTDMDEASARLTALQTQQQLATQLLSITTQNQSTLVQTLFRGF